jgi:hypothetical protein
VLPGASVASGWCGGGGGDLGSSLFSVDVDVAQLLGIVRQRQRATCGCTTVLPL